MRGWAWIEAIGTSDIGMVMNHRDSAEGKAPLSDGVEGVESSGPSGMGFWFRLGGLSFGELRFSEGEWWFSPS
jgi:hypothetical protein